MLLWQSFYTLIKEGKINKKTGEVMGRGVKYEVSFNAPYADYIERGLAEGGQFYAVPLKLIADRSVRRNPILFNFIDYLVYTRGGRNFAIKASNLLRKLGVKDDEMKRQPKCFERLKACLVYTHKHYPELLQSIELRNKSQDKKLPLSSLSTLDSYTYKDFSQIVKATLGCTDLRECHIIFYHGKEKKEIAQRAGGQQPQKDQYQYVGGSQGSGIIGRVLSWTENWEKENNYPIKKTQKEREKFLLDYEKKMFNTDNSLEKVFEDYANRDHPNAFDFLIKVLPAKLKEEKAKNQLQNHSAKP